MKVVIVGAGRRRNGIGEYIGKYFHKHGADVSGVVGTTEETAGEAAMALRKYGIDATPFADLAELIDTQRPDTVVIASPISTHYVYLARCVEAGVNVFCEKPFLWNEADDIEAMLESVLGARRKGTIVAMNSQWPFSLPYYEELVGPVDACAQRQFEMHLSPMSGGTEMIPESMPHALSMLYHIFGTGRVEGVRVECTGEIMVVTFVYVSGSGGCACTVSLNRAERQPRPFGYGFNGRLVRRIVDMESYGIYFCYGDRTVKLIDPVELSVKDFMDAVRHRREPLIGPSHIATTTVLLKTIYRRTVWQQ
jgi:predicted dehydrogenase